MPELILPQFFWDEPFNGDFYKILGIERDHLLTKETVNMAWLNAVSHYDSDSNERLECIRAMFQIKQYMLEYCLTPIDKSIEEEFQFSDTLLPEVQLAACFQDWFNKRQKLGPSFYTTHTSNSLLIIKGSITIGKINGLGPDVMDFPTHQIQYGNSINGGNLFRPFCLYAKKQGDRLEPITKNSEIDEILAALVELIPKSFRNKCIRGYDPAKYAPMIRKEAFVLTDISGNNFADCVRRNNDRSYTLMGRSSDDQSRQLTLFPNGEVRGSEGSKKLDVVEQQFFEYYQDIFEHFGFSSEHRFEFDERKQPASLKNKFSECELTLGFLNNSFKSMLANNIGKKIIEATLRYNFLEFTTTEQGIQSLNELFIQLLTLYQINPNRVDEDYYFKIACWYRDSKDNERHYAISQEVFYAQKTEKLVSLIRPYLPETPIGEKSQLLDIGCGDGEMCVRVAASLHLEKKTAVDILGAEQWGLETGGNEKLDELKKQNSIVYYDGNNLIEKLTEHNNGILPQYDLIMFNHVLHHYPNHKAQLKGLEQAIHLLKPGGVLFLSEHENVMSDREIRMQHILFDIKTCVVTEKHKNPNDLRKQDVYLRTSIAKYAERKGDRDLYFSKALLVRIFQSFGLVLNKQVEKDLPDASRTSFFVVTKPFNWSPKSISNIRSFEEADLELGNREKLRTGFCRI